MRVGVPKETAAGERRVGLVPDAVGRLEGFDVAVERGAGEAAGFPDEAYAATGAELVSDAWQGVDAVAKVAKPTSEELGRLSSGQLLIAFLAPLTDRDGVERLTAAWLAGISHMPWWRFLFWNAAGGVVWATAFGVVAYYSGRAAADAINQYGLYAGIGLAVLIVIAAAGIHFWRRRMIDNRQ